MTDAITRKHQIISTGFLNKIKFPSGYERFEGRNC